MRDALEHCPARDRVYFDGSDPRYLNVVRSDSLEGESFVGKVIDGGATAASMDDLKRNILSILTRISPGRRGEDDVKVRHWLKTAASVPGFIGFAVGRTTFWDPLVAWRSKKATREQAVAEIAGRYREFVGLFEPADLHPPSAQSSQVGPEPRSSMGHR